jgi:formylglycine-generating enzyme required for sulfatase activity
VPPPEPRPEARIIECADWPLAADEARKRQAAAGAAARTVDLGGGVKLDLACIPAGRFVMGDAAGQPDEQPQSAVAIEKSFWMGRCEVTNEQFARFDASHDSRFEHRTSWQFSEEYLGWRLNHPKQPVVRVSWDEAMAFCRWLSEKTGAKFTLPTEAQWEYAARAGTAAPLSYGDLDADFSTFANMADVSIRNLAYEGWRPLPPDLVPRDARFDDRSLVTADVGTYQPNPWGLFDMHGNAAEWTRTLYRPYPYDNGDGRNDPAADGSKVVRGGSWYDRPARCRSAFRLAYRPYEKVFNVGFRVICEDVPVRQTAAAKP